MTRDFTSTDFRAALGRYPTGVVVVAAVVDGTPVGLAVNSFTSVSLEPPLVAFCMDRRSTTWPVLRRADGFTISVLAEDQDEVCLAFAEKDRDRFAGVAWQPGPLGHPRLSGAVSWLDCRIHRIDDAGDHELVLGEVRHLEVHDQPSLVFHAGRFARLEDRDSTAAARLPSSAFTGLHGLDVAAPFFDVLAARINGAAASSPKEGRP